MLPHAQGKRLMHVHVCKVSMSHALLCMGCMKEGGCTPEMSKAAAAAVMASGSGWLTPSYESTHSRTCAA